jgi:hypothetical protein
MIKELKYITLSVIENSVYELKSFYNDLSKPRELIKYLFIIFIIEIIMYQIFYASIILLLIILTHIWNIIKRGDWRRKLKESQKNI